MTTAQEVIQLARSYLGMRQYTPQHTQLIDDYNRVTPKPVGYTATYDDDWCDIFVTVVADKAHAAPLIGRECGVQRHLNWFKANGIFHLKTTYTPQTGDIIIFDWDGGGFADHIGFVEKCDPHYVYTIEGNSVNATVTRRQYRLNTPHIVGYAQPRYNQAPQSKPHTQPKATNQSNSTPVSSSQSQLKQTLPPQITLPQLKPHSLIVQEVLAGKWGNGEERMRRLRAAGYNPNTIQQQVNQLYAKPHQCYDFR